MNVNQVLPMPVVLLDFSTSVEVRRCVVETTYHCRNAYLRGRFVGRVPCPWDDANEREPVVLLMRKRWEQVA